MNIFSTTDSYKLERSVSALLATYDQRKLKYYDTTTGHIIADHVAKNPYTIMRQNDSNAIIALGSAKGTVEWWTPGIGTPTIKMFVGLAFLILDFIRGICSQQQKIQNFGMRECSKSFILIFFKEETSIEVSQSGLLAISYGFKVDIFKDSYQSKQTHPYITYSATRGNINNFLFVNFQLMS